MLNAVQPRIQDFLGEWGVKPKGGGCQLIIRLKLFQKLHENERNWTMKRGSGVPDAPLESPLVIVQEIFDRKREATTKTNGNYNEH